MKSITDESLVREVVEGNVSAFETLVIRYQHKLYGFVRSVVRDSHAAEDVVQETFIRLYKTIDRVDTSRKFSSFAYTIARNCAYSYLRAHKAHVPLEEAADIPSRENIETEYEKREDKRAVAQAMRSIDPKYRNVISLYYFEDLSYEEISKKLRLPVNTVRTHLKRAKEMLKGKLTI